MDNEKDKKTITLTVPDVTPEARYIFNKLCHFREVFDQDIENRGEYLTRMIEEEAKRVFGPDALENIAYEYASDQEATKISRELRLKRKALREEKQQDQKIFEPK